MIAQEGADLTGAALGYNLTSVDPGRYSTN
jgi:hypothetical protein